MTDEQKLSADKIVKSYKDNNGKIININNVIVNLQDAETSQSALHYASHILLSKGILMHTQDGVNRVLLMLSDKGWAYESFDKLIEDEFAEKKIQQDLIDSSIRNNKASKISNKWSPVFAGLAAIVTLASLVKDLIKDKQHTKTIEQFQQQTTRQDSLLKIQQTQINSLLREKARLDSVVR